MTTLRNRQRSTEQRTRRPRVRLALLAVLAGTGLVAQAGEAAPKFVERMADRALLERVRLGGYVLYIRHGPPTTAAPTRCRWATSRIAAASGCSMRQAGNWRCKWGSSSAGPPSREPGLHSPLCRARDTRLAFPQQPGGVQQVDGLLYTANLTQAEKQPENSSCDAALAVRARGAGANRVIVAHAPNMADLIGYFVRPEGTVVIIQPAKGRGSLPTWPASRPSCGPACWHLEPGCMRRAGSSPLWSSGARALCSDPVCAGAAGAVGRGRAELFRGTACAGVQSQLSQEVSADLSMAAEAASISHEL